MAAAQSTFDMILIGWDGPCALLAIGQCRRDNERPLPSYSHVLDASVHAHNDLSQADPESEGTFPIKILVKHFPVWEGALVEQRDLRAHNSGIKRSVHIAIEHELLSVTIVR